nr:hypothetical protein [Mycetocola zhadangensis]
MSGSSRPQVVVLDYGSGNVHSAVKALEAAGANVELTGNRQKALDADGLLVPGVGAFSAVMDQLAASRGAEVIDRRLAGGRKVLGICVGMQVLFERGVERGIDTKDLANGQGSSPNSTRRSSRTSAGTPSTHRKTRFSSVASATNVSTLFTPTPPRSGRSTSHPRSTSRR